MQARSPFLAAEEKYPHKPLITHALGTTYLLGGPATAYTLGNPLFGLVGVVTGLGLIGSQVLYNRYPEISHATAISFSTYATMRMMANYRSTKQRAPIIWAVFGVISTTYHLFQI